MAVLLFRAKPVSGSTSRKWDTTCLALLPRMYRLASLSPRWDSCQIQSIATEQSWRDVCRNSGIQPGQVCQAEHRAFCSFHSVGGRVWRSHCYGTSRTFKCGTLEHELELCSWEIGRSRCFWPIFTWLMWPPNNSRASRVFILNSTYVGREFLFVYIIILSLNDLFLIFRF